MLVLFVYYVYDNPTYKVANKLICILCIVTNYVTKAKCTFKLYEINQGLVDFI